MNKRMRYLVKQKIPEDMKTHYWYCRNCNEKNKDSELQCRQCEKPQPENKMRRPYK